MFTMRIANGITNRVTVQPLPEDLDAFPADAHFDMCCIDRTIYLERTIGKGNCQALEHQPYCCDDYPIAIRRTIKKTMLPAFTVNEAQFILVDNTLSWHIPPDHELPWSSTRPRNNTASVAAYQLGLRIRSAKAAGVNLQVVTSRAPSWARGVLQPSVWRSIVMGLPV
jgi:hypothetical protein